jgi:hypothetical protein
VHFRGSAGYDLSRDALERVGRHYFRGTKTLFPGHSNLCAAKDFFNYVLPIALIKGMNCVSKEVAFKELWSIPDPGIGIPVWKPLETLRFETGESVLSEFLVDAYLDGGAFPNPDILNDSYIAEYCQEIGKNFYTGKN